MPAQIRPNRMEVSDRFPMLGFSIRTDRPNIDAEVALATDTGLFAPENRHQRTAANFYSSREGGRLTVPHGEGVFVVPSDVLARFIGGDRLFFGLATGHANNGGMNVDAMPREGSPYVSLRELTGRTLRRANFGGRGRGSQRAPVFEWAGDQAKPGTEPTRAANGAGGGNGSGGYTNGSAARDPVAPQPYDDGFGAMPAPAPAAQAQAYRRQALAADRTAGVAFNASSFTVQGTLDWIQDIVTRGLAAVASDVNPPHLYRVPADWCPHVVDAFKLWCNTVGFMPGLSLVPDIARSSGVTLSIGPALDTPVAGAGVGIVFAPDGSVGIFGTADITLSFDGIAEFLKELKLALQAKFKLGYNAGGLSGFESIRKAAGLSVGDGLVIGSEVWFDAHDRGLGGAASVGVGFAFQLGMPDPPRPMPHAAKPRHDLPAGAAPRAYAQAASQALDFESRARAAVAWVQGELQKGLVMAADPVSAPALYHVPSAWTGAFTTAWRIMCQLLSPGLIPYLMYMPEAARAARVSLIAGPVVGTPIAGGGIGVVFGRDGDVALFGAGEFSLSVESIDQFLHSLKLNLQAAVRLGVVNGSIADFAQVAKVAEVSFGEEIIGGLQAWLDLNDRLVGGALSLGVGFSVQFEAEDPAAMPSLFDPRARARRIGGQFSDQIGRALDLGLEEKMLVPLFDVLDPPAAAQPMGARAMDGGLGAAVAIAGIVVSTLTSSAGDVTWDLDQGRGIKHPGDVAPANPAPMRDGDTITITGPASENYLGDMIRADFEVRWQCNGKSLGNVVIGNLRTNDAVGWGLAVRAQLMDDNIVYAPDGCAALRIRFHWRFTRTIGSDLIAVSDLKLLGDGRTEFSTRWTQQ